MSILKPSDLTDVEHARQALNLLRKARDHLAAAKAGRAADRVRSAINSTEGALRHAENKRNRPQ